MWQFMQSSAIFVLGRANNRTNLWSSDSVDIYVLDYFWGWGNCNQYGKWQVFSEKSFKFAA